MVMITFLSRAWRITNDDGLEVIETAKKFAVTEGRKVVISVLYGSSLLTQFPTLEAWPGLGFEVLTPSFVRVSNQWMLGEQLILEDLKYH